MLWSLFLTFLKIGFISFGGGYSMVPVIHHEVLTLHWMEDPVYTQTVFLAGMTPGPIAANIATLIGYQTAGIWGAVFATTGILLPSMILVILVSSVIFKMRNSRLLVRTFYGLKPAVTALIFFAVFNLGSSGKWTDLFTWAAAGKLMITAVAIAALLKYRLHPFPVIVISGMLGIVFFQ